MSVFGGDSWARESQQRKRRLDELLLPTSNSASSSSSSASGSFKRLSSGKFACLVCPRRPILDTPLMLSMHNKGSRHITAESRLREKELSMQQEINKRLALSSQASFSNNGNQHSAVRPSDLKEKPLVQQTRMAVLEAQSRRFSDFSANKESHDLKRTKNNLFCDSLLAPSGIPMEKMTGNTDSIESNNSKGKPSTGYQTQGKVLSQWQADLQKRQEQELRFTASGWKRDCHGMWYRDENVEFDSDEDDPNICLS